MGFICPYTCSYRTNSGYCGSTGGFERCQYRQLHQPNTVVGYVPPLKKTNADRIRAMTDEELAEFFHSNFRDAAWCDTSKFPENDCMEVPCLGCILDWLRQEESDG